MRVYSCMCVCLSAWKCVCVLALYICLSVSVCACMRIWSCMCVCVRVLVFKSVCCASALTHHKLGKEDEEKIKTRKEHVTEKQEH